MPVIVFASPKGGAGKTTSALVLATQIARHSPVTVIDADPNRPIKNWAEGENTPAGFHVIADADEENILDFIEDATSKTPYVVVDLEGTASKIVLLAVSQADLVIIPMQPSQLDADQASRALRVVRQQEKISRRAVPYGVLFTRTNTAVRSRTLRHISQTLTDSGIRVFRSELNEREAFRAMFAFSEPLEKLDPTEVSNVPKAIENAEWFAEEVAEMLREASTVGDANG